MNKNRTPRSTAPVILMAKSDIKAGFAPVALGTFATVGEATRKGREHFKTLPWLVGRDTGRKRENGIDTDYEYLSETFNPRRGYGDE